SSPSGCPPRPGPTASWSSTAAASSRKAPTPNCWPNGATITKYSNSRMKASRGRGTPMASNRFDVDETLESPFDIRHFRRAMTYIRKQRKPMLVAFILSALSAGIGLTAPLILQHVVDVTIPNGEVLKLFGWAGLMLATIVVSVIFA